MARSKAPEWGIDSVQAICRGYDMRQQYMTRYSCEKSKVNRVYIRYNKAIDGAIDKVCEWEAADTAAALKRSLIDSVPWERLPECPCGRRRFYELRSAAISEIGKLLGIF